MYTCPCARTVLVSFLSLATASAAPAHGPAFSPNAQSAGIAAFDVTVDESGAVAAADIVQDVAPYGATLRDAVRGWTFEPAHDQGRASRSRVLVLAFVRPPSTAVLA